jgi:hypothetical protein
MNTKELTTTLTTLCAELVDGAPASQECYVLNRGDAGLLRSLATLSAADASQAATGATIAAHVDHLRYGLSLMNRWAAGENPFADADWSKSWRITSVSAREWDQLKDQLRAEAHRWFTALRAPREVTETELNGIVGSIVHLAYHLGAIRQIHSKTRGPAEPSQ